MAGGSREPTSASRGAPAPIGRSDWAAVRTRSRVAQTRIWPPGATRLRVIPPMGRPRTKNRDLPPGMHRKQGRYYYGQNDIALGANLVNALKRWAELHGERVHSDVPTLADAIREYRLTELPQKSPKTQKGYRPQLVLLDKVFGKMPLGAITPTNVRGYMRRRPAISGTREKALLSAVFNFARGEGMTNAPNPCAGVR